MAGVFESGVFESGVFSDTDAATLDGLYATSHMGQLQAFPPAVLLGMASQPYMGKLSEVGPLAGITIDPDTGIISIDTALTGPLNDYSIAVRATNAVGTATDTFLLTVNDLAELTGMTVQQVMGQMGIAPVGLDGMISTTHQGLLATGGLITSGLVAHWTATAGVGLSGSDVTAWTDQIGSAVLSPTLGTVTYSATGNPAGGPMINLALTSKLSMSGLPTGTPTGAADRTMYFVCDWTTAAAIHTGVMYGTGAAREAFGIVMASYGVGSPLRADYWSYNFDGAGGSVLDDPMSVYALRQNSGAQELFTDGSSVVTSSEPLNTGSTTFAIGHLTASTSHAISVCALLVYDTAHDAGQIAQMQTYFSDLYLT